jgi:hypothetical protein
MWRDLFPMSMFVKVKLFVNETIGTEPLPKSIDLQVCSVCEEVKVREKKATKKITGDFICPDCACSIEE